MYNTPYAYANPYQNFMPNQMQSQAPVQPQQVIKVNGKNGAEAFQMAPNSSALLLDESAPIIWLAQTDGAGYKTVTAYDISVHQELPPIDLGQLEARINRIEEVLRNGSESNNANVKQWKSNDDPFKSNQTGNSDRQRGKQSSNDG